MNEQQSRETSDELISKDVSSRWQLIWHDEFDGPPGSKPDERKWTSEVGGGGWGNQELEYYTDHNAYEDGKGHLVIEARLEYPANSSCWYGPCRYTSARLISKGKFALTYGRVEARIKIPSGQGIWPAFWMLGQDIDVVGWPNCGEIDIMENIGREPATIHGTINGPNYSGAGGIGGSYSLEEGRFADRFHRFAMEWDPNEIAFFVDGTAYFTVTRAAVEQRGKWVFDHPFYLLLNVAVGGGWPGDPDSSSTYPQSLLVDYVRVYQRR
jgi:beta-glucanase (GH16 family)